MYIYIYTYGSAPPSTRACPAAACGSPGRRWTSRSSGWRRPGDKQIMIIIIIIIIMIRRRTTITITIIILQVLGNEATIHNKHV